MTSIISIFKTSLMALMLFMAFISVKQVFAQTASSSANPNPAQKYNVTFPIVELGGCKDYVSCRNYCNDPVHKDTCITFAKSKGFYKEDGLTTQKDAILAKAKATLGCDSETSCLNFCSIPSNQDKCNSFAQSTNLQGGVINSPENQTILSKAKEVLGCSSESNCMSFCAQDVNKAKCADFAHQLGLNGGEEKLGPGGCTSEQTCQAFCSNPNNFQICASFTKSVGSNFSGPGGCNTPEACKTYCQQNPQACPVFSNNGQNSQTGFNPAEMCNRTPSCSWTGTTCYCGNLNPGTNISDQSGSNNAAATCVRFGCTYTNSGCQCQNIGSNYNLDSAKQGCEAGKGTWNGSYCNMSSGNSPYSGGANYQQQEAVCKSGGGGCAPGSTANFCNCQGYQAPQYSPNPATGTYPSSGGNNYYSPCTSSVCSAGYGPDPSNNCACVPIPTGAPRTCQPPSGGCGSNSYYDYSRCGCYQNSQTPPQLPSTSTATSPPPQSNPPPPPPPPPAAPASSPSVHGISTSRNLIQILWEMLTGH